MSRLKSLLIALAGVVAFGPTAMAEADIAAVAVKRYFLVQVNARCGLFDDATAKALSAGYVQTRNAVLRGGNTMEQLSPWLARARTVAERVACDDPEVITQANAARHSYGTFRGQFHLNLPSQRSAWTATRAHAQDTAWRLVQYQNMPGGDAALGLYGALDRYSFVVMTRFKDGARPYSARLLIRDPSRVHIGLINPAAYDISRSAPMGLSETGAISFTARAASQSMATLTPRVTANAAGFSPTGSYVGKQQAGPALRFDFPSAAFPAMARLDPREDVVVVFECDDGPRYVRFEVGDFITGLTWVGLPA